MKAALVGPEFGKEHLKVTSVNKLSGDSSGLMVKITLAALNPLDYNLIHGRIIYNLAPVPHVPGSEAIGIAQENGENIKKGDKVIIYNRRFDSTCRFCREGMEQLCDAGGILGVVTNGFYADEAIIPEKNLFKMPAGVSDEVAVSLPIAGLTALHALRAAGAKSGDDILIYGASGNTGLFASQISDKLGLNVYGISRKGWVSDYGCHTVYQSASSIPEGKKFDIVLNSLGTQFWEDSLNRLGKGGRLVTFGTLTGRESRIDISRVYSNEQSIIGSTGGTLKEMSELIDMASKGTFRIRVDKTYDLDKLKDALSRYEEPHDGRILIRI
ncbi:alcohol dehydrogenase catalytic domain-containing protein [Thermoplasmatales archaeon AK]|nr:alcohol dehydrogenase catalytic domain-containing protein [Thermoplasmatales archaeon AK]